MFTGKISSIDPYNQFQKHLEKGFEASLNAVWEKLSTTLPSIELFNVKDNQGCLGFSISQILSAIKTKTHCLIATDETNNDEPLQNGREQQKYSIFSKKPPESHKSVAAESAEIRKHASLAFPIKPDLIQMDQTA